MRLLFISSKGYNFVSNSKAWYGQARQAAKQNRQYDFPFLFENAFFASDFAYRPLVFGENDHRITHLFRNALQSEDF